MRHDSCAQRSSVQESEIVDSREEQNFVDERALELFGTRYHTVSIRVQKEAKTTERHRS